MTRGAAAGICPEAGVATVTAILSRVELCPAAAPWAPAATIVEAPAISAGTTTGARLPDPGTPPEPAPGVLVLLDARTLPEPYPDSGPDSGVWSDAWPCAPPDASPSI